MLPVINGTSQSKAQLDGGDCSPVLYLGWALLTIVALSRDIFDQTLRQLPFAKRPDGPARVRGHVIRTSGLDELISAEQIEGVGSKVNQARGTHRSSSLSIPREPEPETFALHGMPAQRERLALRPVSWEPSW